MTDLLAPRPAFWRATVGAPPVTAEREAVLEKGRRLHRILGTVFAPQGQLEVRVHDDRTHGRIDVLADRPIEIKTSAYPPPTGDPAQERPEHVDQVAVYAQLLGTPLARLVYLQAVDDDVRAAAVYDLSIQSPETLRAAVDRRTSDLTAARNAGSPAGLPRCPWFSRGCEFRGASVCDCSGEEDPPERLVGAEGVRSEVRPEAAARLVDSVRARLANAPTPAIERFRDLLYPRRAYWESMGLAPGAPAPAFEPDTDTFSRLAEALDAGPIGESTRLPTLADEPDEEVGGFRGAPVLVRTSRASTRLDPRTVVDRSPQYALQLGFRCVATGMQQGRLVLGYERASESERIQVLEFRFQPASAFSRLWRRRTRELVDARSAGDPGRLPMCPAWMFESCPYRDRCACAGSPGRSQR